MQRVHFTVEDLARTRVSRAGLSAETLFAMDLLGGTGGDRHFGPWRRIVQHRLGPRSRALARLAKFIQVRRGLLFSHDFRDMIRALPAPENIRDDEALAMISRFHQIAVAPYWRRVLGYLEADRESRARIVLSLGIEGLLSSLSPQVRWRPPVLEIVRPNAPETDIHLNGRGLIVAPSVFLSTGPSVHVGSAAQGDPPALIYPTPLTLVSAASLWEPQYAGHRALGALVGNTRAAILQALVDTCTTSELGQKMGISAAAASQHTSVLREAGLITTHREKNRVLHTLTCLGAALIKGNDFDGRSFSAHISTMPKPRAAMC